VSSLLTPELADKLIAGVKRGLFESQTALNAGISPSTLRSWVMRGIQEGAEDPYLSFAERWVKEGIKIETMCVERILTASVDRKRKTWAKKTIRRVFSGDGEGGPPSEEEHDTETETVVVGDWKACAWYLERRFPKRWGQSRQPDQGPKEAFELPDTFRSRQSRALQLAKRPTPELIDMFRDAGYELVKKKA
jgi:hypothetical protein